MNNYNTMLITTRVCLVIRIIQLHTWGVCEKNFKKNTTNIYIYI